MLDLISVARYPIKSHLMPHILTADAQKNKQQFSVPDDHTTQVSYDAKFHLQHEVQSFQFYSRVSKAKEK